MNRRLLIFVILALLLGGWLAWSYALPHTTLSEGPMNYSEAQSISPVPLPPTATSIRVATYRHMFDSNTYIRLTAPLEDCRQMALRLVPGSAPETIKIASTRPDDLPPPESSSHFTAKELAWFDANHVTMGERYVSSDHQSAIIISFLHAPDSQATATLYYRQGE